MKMGNNVGKAVKVHVDTVKRKDVRFGRVLVNTPMFEVIRKKSSILINGNLYPINLVEEIVCEARERKDQSRNQIYEENKEENP